MTGMRILLSGCWDEKYAGNATHALLSEYERHALRDVATLVLHRPPVWALDQAKRAGRFEVLGWVESYHALMNSIDVQIFPIAIGTGTKGKVLSAMSAGCICIGTPYAFSNISPRPSPPHYRYASPLHGLDHLSGLHTRVDASKQEALNYAKQLLAEHNPAGVIGKMWGRMA